MNGEEGDEDEEMKPEMVDKCCNSCTCHFCEDYFEESLGFDLYIKKGKGRRAPACLRIETRWEKDEI